MAVINALARFGKFLLIFILVILGIILVAGVILYANYFFTRQISEDYLPNEYLFYTHVDSLDIVYDNLLDLKALDSMLNASGQGDVYDSLIDFRSSPFARQEWFKALLDVESDVVVETNGELLIVFDLKAKSIVSRVLPFLGSLYRVEGFDYTVHSEGDHQIYEYFMDNENSLFISFEKNLVLLALTYEGLSDVFYRQAEGRSLNRRVRDLNRLKKEIRSDGMAEVFINTSSVLDQFAEMEEAQPILEKFDFDEDTVLSFSINNEELFLSTFTDIAPKDEMIEDFLKYRTAELGVLKYLPQSTNVYSSINFQSFYGLLNLMATLDPEMIGDLLEKAEKSCETFFDMNLEELLRWTGKEAGLITVNRSADPLFYMQMSSQKEFDRFLEKLTDSIFIEEDNSLILDGFPINQIGFPSFLQSLFSLFVQGLDNPYYVQIDNYLFFSMNPENLASLKGDLAQEKRLVETEIFKKITDPIQGKGNLFFYFDTELAYPTMLNNIPQVVQLLSLYNKGAASISFSEDSIKLEVSARGAESQGTHIVTGFPKELGDDIQAFQPVTLDRSRKQNVIYSTKNQKLLLNSSVGEAISSLEMTEKFQLVDIYPYEDFFITYTPSGIITLFDGEMNLVDGYPILTDCRISVEPRLVDDTLFFYNRSNKMLNSLNIKTGEWGPMGEPYEKHLLSPPRFLGDLMTYYPKSLEGTVYLADKRGTVLPGWPQSGQSLSYDSPLLFSGKQGSSIAYLSQSGVLFNWDIKGNSLEGFPFQLDGLYYHTPEAYGSGKELKFLVLSDQGELSQISQEGALVKSREINGVSGKDWQITVADLNGDGEQEIFLSGGGDSIYALNSQFRLIEGFPLIGNEFSFIDINGDGLQEILSHSLDGKIYLYNIDGGTL